MIKIGTIVKVSSSSKLVGIIIDKQDKCIVAFGRYKAKMYNEKDLKQVDSSTLSKDQIKRFKDIAKLFQINPINLVEDEHRPDSKTVDK